MSDATRILQQIEQGNPSGKRFLMSKLVCLMTFETRSQAGLAKSMLEANGINATVSADDAGGMRPDIGFASGGVGLFVLEEYAGKAAAVLRNLSHEKPDRKGSESEITFECEECGETISLPSDRKGGVETCPFCYEYVDVPE